ncbi:MAG: ABC transporter substrate-binding protein, partial [Bacteroidia bacterium]|nr:ABC transporter substrate-binding protein [Bacteroidia bacterium]
RVGGTKDFDTDRIRALKPDLILANKEENTQKGIQELMKEFPVWVSDISHLDDALNMIASTGTLTGKDERAMSIIQEIRHGFDALAGDPQLEALRGKRAVYYIWKKPWMVAGSDTFICDMMKRCGFIPFPVPPRYPELDPALLASSDIDYVLLSSEPYPFGEKERVLIENLLPDSRIRLVDGTFFSWYGSRLKNAPSYFNSVFR